MSNGNFGLHVRAIFNGRDSYCPGKPNMRGMQEYYKNIEDKLKQLSMSYTIHYARAANCYENILSPCCLFIFCFVAIARVQMHASVPRYTA